MILGILFQSICVFEYQKFFLKNILLKKTLGPKIEGNANNFFKLLILSLVKNNNFIAQKS
jgi:hypothetical protein